MGSSLMFFDDAVIYSTSASFRDIAPALAICDIFDLPILSHLKSHLVFYVLILIFPSPRNRCLLYIFSLLQL